MANLTFRWWSMVQWSNPTPGEASIGLQLVGVTAERGWTAKRAQATARVMCFPDILLVLLEHIGTKSQMLQDILTLLGKDRVSSCSFCGY